MTDALSGQMIERALPHPSPPKPVWVPTLSDIELTSVTSHGWRVSDGRLPLRDPLRLLAFIEQRGDTFEVMQLGAGFQWHEFECLVDAIAFVVRTAPELASERMHGDLAWVR